MPTVQFIGSSRQDADNIAASPARLINLYREPAGESRMVLKAVPGMQAFANTAAVGRAISEVNGQLYVVAGGVLWRIDSGASASSLGAVADDVSTTIAGYRENVMVTADGVYQVYDGTALSTVTGGAFDNVGSVAFLSGWTILTEEDGARFEWTELQDPKTRNALHVASAEGRDDKIIRAVVFGDYLYLMKQTSTEVWALTGQAGANAFGRLGGGVIDQGLLARNLVTVFDRGIFFIGNDKVAYLYGGTGDPIPVSSPSVETAIDKGQPTHCFYYEREGRKFCVIRFADRPSWIYDMTMQEWHERAEGNTLEPWGVYGAARAFGNWHALDVLGRVSVLGPEVSDFGETLLRKAVSMVFEVDEDRFTVPKLIAKARSGWGGANLTLRTSKDGSITWSPPKSRSIGEVGQYRQRAVWRNLGQFRQFTAELTMAEPTDAPIYTDWSIQL